MKIYWSLKSIPEFPQLSAKERRAAWRRVYWATYRHWLTWVGLLIHLGCVLSGYQLGNWLGHSMLGSMAGGGIGGCVFTQFSIHVARFHSGGTRGVRTEK
ncbi:hypothetical protein J2793_007033 [Paraburkholderia caledonica]|uniref:Uncharacterized protein n=1 Tax=Paraburkholderia caledonica TaxID=134536 RepID=A0AB73INI3_9BURK|nr:hypothetical protein [Paraburkholderia caledonica]